MKNLKLNQLTSIILTIIILIIIFNEAFLRQDIIKNASALSTNKVSVYWDQNCTKPVTSIKWGVLSPGDTKTITLYTRNEDNTSLVLTITTTNWDPNNANQFLTLSCKQNNTTIEPQKTIKIQLTLHVNPNIKDIKDFSFDIMFEGKTKTFLPTDLNKDGVIDMTDITIVAKAYGSKLGDPGWNEIADVDKNGVVDALDLSLVARDYGKILT